jgi:aminoglycoside phosphotransferase (APT) family kinase protein
MALVNATPLDDIAGRFEATLRKAWSKADAVTVSDVSVPNASGMSNETILFDAAWDEDGEHRTRRLVARVQPATQGLFLEYDITREHRIMTALAGAAGVPVPKVLLLETDPSVIGAPFLVMDRVEGRSPTDDPPFTVAGWVLDLPPAQRRVVCDEALNVMAAIHALDWRALGLGFLDRQDLGGEWIEQRFAYDRRFYEWAAQGQRFPLIETAFHWLDTHRPTGAAAPVLNWGDPRISNIVYGDDLTARAVLDWEVALLGPPEVDLGWNLFTNRHHTSGIGAPLPEGFPTVAETIAAYEGVSGRTVQDVEFYEVLAGTRGAIMMVRAAGMMVEAGFLPPDTPMAASNPASKVLAELLGEPVPTGETTSFIGNRASK